MKGEGKRLKVERRRGYVCFEMSFGINKKKRKNS
jgi:hypothetical protein